MNLITLDSMLPTIEAKTPGQPSIDKVIAGARRQVNQLVLDYATGKAPTRNFVDNVARMLTDRHARAAVLGRQLAGDRRPRNMGDDIFASMVTLRERDYLERFRRDLQAGRYTDEEGNPKVSQIQQRALAYTGKLVGTANEAFVAASWGHSFHWIMGAAEEHCEDCPRLAREGPYQWDNLPTVPRANKTQCKFNCRCHLKRDDGLEGFYAVE